LGSALTLMGFKKNECATAGERNNEATYRPATIATVTTMMTSIFLPENGD